MEGPNYKNQSKLTGRSHQKLRLLSISSNLYEAKHLRFDLLHVQYSFIGNPTGDGNTKNANSWCAYRTTREDYYICAWVVGCNVTMCEYGSYTLVLYVDGSVSKSVKWAAARFSPLPSAWVYVSRNLCMEACSSSATPMYDQAHTHAGIHTRFVYIKHFL